MVPDIAAAIEQAIQMVKDYQKPAIETSLVITKLEEALLWFAKTEVK